MSKRLSLVLILLVLALFSSAQAQTELKHTVKPSGQGGDFTSLAAAISHLAASHSNLVSANVFATIEIDGAWSAPDAARVTIQNITADATHYIYIYTTAAARHPGYPSASAYLIKAAGGGSAVIQIANDHVRVEGIQVWNTTTWGDSHGIRNPSDDVKVSKCIARTDGSAQHGFMDDDATTNSCFYNCLAYSCGGYGFMVHKFAYNCTPVHNTLG